MALSVEVAELAEIFLWKDTDDSELLFLSALEITKVKEEIGDIYIYFLMLCDRFMVDPNEVAKNKLHINQGKYPIAKAKNSSKKYTTFNKSQD